MELEIKPEPSKEERTAIEAALAAADAQPEPPLELEEGDDEP